MAEQFAAMPGHSEQLDSKISRAVADGQLMEPAAKNANVLLRGARSDLYLRSVSELVDADEWSELNDRFYQTLAFGTGGLRGRTIGKIITGAEQGNALEGERPEFPMRWNKCDEFLQRQSRNAGTGCVPSRLPPRPRNLSETHNCDRA